MRASIFVSLRLVMFFLLTALLMAGCTDRASTDTPASELSQPTPTVSAVFSPAPPIVVVQVPTPARNTAEASAARLDDTYARRDGQSRDVQVAEVLVYDDALDDNWTLENSSMMSYNLQNMRYIDRGRYAIEAAPTTGIGMLYFTLRQDSRQVFRRDQVLGLRFRLTGGADFIENDALAVTVVGSNRQPYWVAGDNSVNLEGRVTDDEPVFSETRLYYLDINQPIPPDTWVDVVLWLDERIYDPDYTYVTGFYLKTEKDLLDRFYVDQVNLLLDPSVS